MSRPAPSTTLPEVLVSHLVGGQISVVATIDEDGRPSTTLMSWVVALSPSRLVLCVDTRSRAYANLAVRRGVALEVLGDDLVWGVRGVAKVAKERMESTPFPCAIVEVAVDDVRDHSASGTHFQGPGYRYADGKAHRHDLEDRIFAELRSLG